MDGWVHGRVHGWSGFGLLECELAVFGERVSLSTAEPEIW